MFISIIELFVFALYILGFIFVAVALVYLFVKKMNEDEHKQYEDRDN